MYFKYVYVKYVQTPPFMLWAELPEQKVLKDFVRSERQVLQSNVKSLVYMNLTLDMVCISHIHYAMNVCT